MEFLSKQKGRLVRLLGTRKGRRKEGQFVIEGFRLADAALDAQAEILFWVVSESTVHSPVFRKLRSRIRERIFQTTSDEFNQLSDVETSQGILGVARIPAPASPFIEAARILVLDEVREPGNAGTLMRTAAWFGVTDVLCGPGTVDLYSQKAVRASMGGIWGVSVHQTDNLSGSLSDLRGFGFRLFAAGMGGTHVADWHPGERSVLVLGNEAHGLSEIATDVADEIVTIPGAGHQSVESLNVGVAGAILMAKWTDSY